MSLPTDWTSLKVTPEQEKGMPASLLRVGDLLELRRLVDNILDQYHQQGNKGKSHTKTQD